MLPSESGEVHARALVDTGAEVSVISQRLAERYSLPHGTGSRQLRMAGGQEATAWFTAELEFTVLFVGDDERSPLKLTHAFAVAPLDLTDDHEVLLGCDILTEIFPHSIPLDYYTSSTEPSHRPPRDDDEDSSWRRRSSGSEGEETSEQAATDAELWAPLHIRAVLAAQPATDADPITEEEVQQALEETEREMAEDDFVNALNSVAAPPDAGRPAEPKPPDGQTQAAAFAQSIKNLAKTQSDDNGVYGKVPFEEMASRLSVDLSLDGSDQAEERKRRWRDRLQGAFDANALVDGFCTLPGAVFHLEVDEEKLNTRARIPQYPIKKALEPFVTAQVEKWKAAGKIKEAPAGCRYNSPLLAVPKRDDATRLLTMVRVCLDLRWVNSCCKNTDTHTIPHVAEVLENLAGCTLFGEFDLSDAYMQFLLDEYSQQFTAFTWQGVQYVFVGAIYGLAPLPAFFQRIMSQLFSGVHFVRPYLDNLPFGSADWDEHIEHALFIINRLTEANLKIKASAAKIGFTAMNCLGRVITRDGYMLDPKKQRDVQDIPFPTNGKAVMSFLGVVGYLREHIRHFAELAAPFEKLKGQSVITETPELRKHFELLKHAVLNAPLIRFPQPDKPLVLATDASNTGVGGVLYQPDEPGGPITANNIVYIVSKSLTASQRRYPAFKKELWAIVCCLRKMHVLLWGRPFHVLTDHRPLTYLFSASKVSFVVEQWLDVIQDYSFTIEHVPGVHNVLPDALSRLYESVYVDPERERAWGVPRVTLSLAARELAGEPGFTTVLTNDELMMGGLEAEARHDPGAVKLVKAVHRETLRQPVAGRAPRTCRIRVMMTRSRKDRVGSENTDKWREQDAQERRLSVYKQLLDAASKEVLQAHTPTATPGVTAANSAIEESATTQPAASEKPATDEQTKLIVALERRGKRAPPTEAERAALIEEQHSLGHFGREAMFAALWHRDIWWPSLRADIDKRLKECMPCLQHNVSKKGFHPSQAVSASGPWSHVQIDLSSSLPPSTEGHVAVLHIIDVFTGFVILRPLKTKEATSVAQELYKVFMLFGWPPILQSDNGPEFTSKVVKALNDHLQIQSRHITPYNPRADGKVERSVGTTLLIVKKLLKGTDRHWPLYLDFAQFTINTKVAALSGSTPYALLFARAAQHIKAGDGSTRYAHELSIEEWRDWQDKVTAIIYPAHDARMKALNDVMRKKMDDHRRIIREPLETGAVVMLRDELRRNKVEGRYVGPYIVTQRTAHGAYLLQDAAGAMLQRPVTLDQLKIVSRKPSKLAEDVYELEAIFDHRVVKGAFEFFVRWKGYGDEHDEWLAADKFNDTRIIKEYWQSRRINPDALLAGGSAGSQLNGDRPSQPGKKRSRAARAPRQ